MSADPGPPPVGVAASRSRKALRLIGILLVLAAELAVLMWAYQLDDVVYERRLEVERVAALSDSLEAGASVGAVRPVLVDVMVDLRGAQTPGAGAIERAVTNPDLDSASGRAELAAAVDDSASLVDAQLTTRDRLVFAIIFSLFLVVCVGWFTWFARLARRHRAVQSELTRREVEAAGERRLRALVRSSADVIAVLEPDSTIAYVTAAATTVLGREPETLVGSRFAELVAVAEDRMVLTRVLARSDGDEQAVSLQVAHADGRLLTLEGTVKDLRHDPAVLGWVITVRDVSDRYVLERDLAHQALHDNLTGLANRRSFVDRLEHALTRREQSLDPLAVLCIDLDDFRGVNDSLGHDLGNELLVTVARRMTRELRPADTAARLGGDEFMALLDNSDGDAATQVAQRLLAALAEPVDLGGELRAVPVSIGVAVLAPDATADPHLMRNADLAMHEAKDRGKHRLVVYDEQLRVRALEEVRGRAELGSAISQGELVLHYQPTVSLETQTISGFEALVRWQHPVRGLVPPLDFIPLAESTGLIVPLGQWVLREACLAAASMQHDGVGPSIAVNVAPQQLADPAFRSSVVDALEESGLSPDRLTLEITETVLLDDAEGGIAVLQDLRRLGLRVGIDDFGTGYNSLARLSTLPLDVLKIDKSFVDRLGGDAADSSLVDAIIGMSRAMELVTVAEGVEGADQARWLREHAATLGQGYLWSRPVPLSAARELLRTGVLVALEPAAPVDLAVKVPSGLP